MTAVTGTEVIELVQTLRDQRDELLALLRTVETYEGRVVPAYVLDSIRRHLR